MKTLDEVIQAVDYCRFSSDCNPCPYRESKSCAREKMTDALHYLQDYRMLSNDFAEKRQELEDEKARYQEAVRNCEEAELKYRKLAQSLGEVGNKLAQSLGEVGNTEIPPIVSDMSEEEAEAIREEIVKSAELRQKLGAPLVEGM